VIYVFDASFLNALIIPDEKDPQLDRMYEKIKDEDERHAPHLIWYETANIFNNLIRRKRYTYDMVVQFFPRLAAFNLTTDFESGAEYSERLLRLCNDYNISAYDAAYLELAGRRKAVLCTLDEGLKAAAKKYGVTTLKQEIT
jgi:predicted nucleic acid-binding protein